MFVHLLLRDIVARALARPPRGAGTPSRPADPRDQAKPAGTSGGEAPDKA